MQLTSPRKQESSSKVYPQTEVVYLDYGAQFESSSEETKVKAGTTIDEFDVSYSALEEPDTASEEPRIGSRKSPRLNKDSGRSRSDQKRLGAQHPSGFDVCSSPDSTTSSSS